MPRMFWAYEFRENFEYAVQERRGGGQELALHLKRPAASGRLRLNPCIIRLRWKN